MSRPVDVKKYGLIYGGAQKNVGPAGVTFVIVREDILGKVDRKLQTMVDYRTHIGEEEKNRSMFNTPPVLPIFVMHETLKWVKSLGGVAAMNKINKEKAALLYNEIDRNKMFVGTAVKEDRSLMNVCFVMADQYKDKEGYQHSFAVPERLETFVETVKNYLALKTKPNSEKRVAIYYYKGAGHGAVMSAGGMEVAPSLYNLLKRLKAEGYKVDNLPSNHKEFEKMIMEQGAVLGVYAEGAIAEFMKKGK